MNIQMSDILGKQIILKLSEEAVRDFAIWDINGEEFFGVVTGLDERLGIWLRHPDFAIKLTKDIEGNYIPEQEQKMEHFEADIFIPWQYIKGIAHIRDDRFIVDKTAKKHIGFGVYKEKRM